MIRALVVSDLHGKHEMLSNAFEKFAKGYYQKFILLGDLADSWDRSDEDILRCYRLAFNMKDACGDRMEILIGNHELSYLYGDIAFRCSGFRPNLYTQLHPYLVANKNVFKYACGIENFLFTHAGISQAWYLKHFDTLSKWADVIGAEITDVTHMATILNAIGNTADMPILNEVGMKRGGYSNCHGGITWADKDEIMNRGPLPGLHQVVGHTPQKFINRQIKFDNDKQYNNTSVTFCDVLDKREQFLTVEINENGKSKESDETRST